MLARLAIPTVKLVLSVILAATAAGCATFERPDYTVSRVMLPNEEGAVTRELGDTLLLQGLEQTSPSVAQNGSQELTEGFCDMF